MMYSQENLEMIEKLASLYMTISEIASLIDVPAEQLRRDIAVKGSDVEKGIAGINNIRHLESARASATPVSADR